MSPSQSGRADAARLAQFAGRQPDAFTTLPFDTLKDLQAVSYMFRTPLVLV